MNAVPIRRRAVVLRAELTVYKVPRIVSFAEALPKSTIGKILRRVLRDLD
ncbi:hypothetical protein [Variovorax sp. GT1P44]